MKFIHYGNNKYDPSLFCEIRNRINKPTGGLWASPINSSYGWKDWCKEHDFRDCNKDDSFTFKLSADARILTIDCSSDINLLLVLEPMGPIMRIDFESIKKSGIDVIYLTRIGEKETRFLDGGLYGWDCESAIILNKDVITS